MVINRKISMRRYRQITAIFAKHGFGLLMDRLGILRYLQIKKKILTTEYQSAGPSPSTGARLRMSLEELGPAFVKLGQVLSTRPDLFPSDVVKELEKLQDSVPPFPFFQVRTVIEEEFKDKLENIYKEFEEKPVAAASISQVHRARLNSGKSVAVKVQRPEIERIIEQDLNILKDLAHFIDKHTQYGKLYDCSGMVLEFESTIKAELDFTKEGENAEVFKKNFKQDEGVMAPEVKWIYTTRRVLTMEYMEGIRVDDIGVLTAAGIDRNKLAVKLATSICNQILRDGFFHADPHPGNIQVMPEGNVVFLDFGMIGRLSESRKKAISDFFIGVASRDSQRVVKAMVDLDTMQNAGSRKRFQKDVDKMIEKYLTLPMDEIKIGDLFYETFDIAFANQIRIPREYTLIAKALGTLQGLLEKLDPDFNALMVAKPIARKLVYHSFSPERMGQAIRRDFRNYQELFKVLPASLLHFFEKLEEDQFILRHEIQEMADLQKCFNKGVNRIAFSIVLLAVSIVIGGILIASGFSAGSGEVMYLFNIRVLKIGLVFAAIIILGLTVSVLRANRL